jgi:D-alanine-D-alanine ligase
MIKPTIVLLTGAGGDAQGWGNMDVTNSVKAAIEKAGYNCRIVLAENKDEMLCGLNAGPVTCVWSSLYFFTKREDIIGIPDDAVWVADVLDQLRIPYIGPSGSTMKALIEKFVTHEILAKANVNVPKHCLFPLGSTPKIDFYPAFVKPNGESRSVGINESSVVENEEQLISQVAYIHNELQQAALVEEYLPGEEYTCMVLGNGENRKVLPGQVTVPKNCYGKYPVLRADLRGVGLTKVSIPTEHYDEACALANAACDALSCEDHVRIDMKVGSNGKLYIMEVNGIPGLKPVKSWSPQIYSLYHKDEDPYLGLISYIIKSALARLEK